MPSSIDQSHYRILSVALQTVLLLGHQVFECPSSSWALLVWYYPSINMPFKSITNKLVVQDSKLTNWYLLHLRLSCNNVFERPPAIIPFVTNFIAPPISMFFMSSKNQILCLLLFPLSSFSNDFSQIAIFIFICHIFFQKLFEKRKYLNPISPLRGK